MRSNEDYLKAMAKAPNDRQRKFERLQQSVPDSLLREGVAKLAISSEAYLSMRSSSRAPSPCSPHRRTSSASATATSTTS